MIEKDFVIENEAGLHARPAARFTKVASKYKSDIELIKGDKVGNGKSLLSVLALGIFKGTRIRIRIVGSDEIEALYGLTRLVDNDFREIGEDL